MNEGVVPQDATEARITTHINELDSIIKVINLMFTTFCSISIYVTIGLQQRCDFFGPSSIHWDVGEWCDTLAITLHLPVPSPSIAHNKQPVTGS